jgi:hypothetical protein
MKTAKVGQIFYTKISAAFEIASRKPIGKIKKALVEAGLKPGRKGHRSGYDVALFESDYPCDTVEQHVEMILVALDNLDAEGKRELEKCTERVIHLGFEADEKNPASAELSKRHIRRMAEYQLSFIFGIYPHWEPPPLPKDARKRPKK